MNSASILDLNETQYLHHISKNESNKGKDEFSLIFDDENKRVQQVVDNENERIMNEMRTNGTIGMCTICLEEIPPIQPHEGNNRGRSGMMMICCDAKHCTNCRDKAMDFMYGKFNAKCFNCREPTRTPKLWAKSIKPNDKRHWLLRVVASEHMKGIGGLKKDIKKALKLYKRAADLGNTIAQDELAFYYFNGCGDSSDSDTIRCFKKAKYYAEKAADQGASNSQYILARLLINISVCNNSRDEEVLQLMTLAAFQGHQQAQYSLASIYQRMSQNKSSVRDEAWRKNLLLRLYWYGKFAEVEKKGPEGCLALPNMALHLHRAMTLLWHPRDGTNRDPLPGYSHVPFCTWALAKGEFYTPLIFSKSPFDCWKHRCANCNMMSEEKEEFKACARCKAFHYCSKKCQVEHWKAGHKVDCKGHWIEEFFPDIRKAQE
jgi:hypothetical protein